MKNFAKNVQFLRRSRNLKQADMERLLGIKDSTWNNYETGRSKPNLSGFVAIAEFFKIDEATLLHIDISVDQHLIEAIKHAVETGQNKVVYKNPVLPADKFREANENQTYSKAAAANSELLKRVANLEADMALLKKKLLKP